MPKLFRVMEEENGQPRVGASGRVLGVRLPGAVGKADIEPDVEGYVYPGTGGMSVSPSAAALLERLPPSMIPKHFSRLADHPFLPAALRPVLRSAAGKSTLCVWTMGEGPFTAGFIDDDLALRVDPGDEQHGFVEPSCVMMVEAFQAALHRTRDAWSKADLLHLGKETG